MTFVVLVLALLLALSRYRIVQLRRRLAQRDMRLAIIEDSWATLLAKHEALKKSSEQQPVRLPTNEQIEWGVW